MRTSFLPWGADKLWGPQAPQNTGPRTGSPSSETGQGMELCRRSREKPTGPMDTGRRGEAGWRVDGRGRWSWKGCVNLCRPPTAAPTRDPSWDPAPSQVPSVHEWTVQGEGALRPRGVSAFSPGLTATKGQSCPQPRLTHISTTNKGPGAGATQGSHLGAGPAHERGGLLMPEPGVQGAEEEGEGRPV